MLIHSRIPPVNSLELEPATLVVGFSNPVVIEYISHQ